MRIAIFGAGGLGGYYGARLAEAGHAVAFIARGDHLQAMHRDGLRVSSPLGDVHLERPVATDDPRAVGPVDLVLVAPWFLHQWTLYGDGFWRTIFGNAV